MKKYAAFVATLSLVVFQLSLLAQGQEDKTKTVKARNISLEVPADWKDSKPSSSMRAAQFKIGEGEQESELVVYYFGGGATGGVKANVERWIGQFEADGREFEMLKGKSKRGEYYWTEISGTYNKPIGPPVAGRTKATKGSQVVGVILIAEKDDKEDYYFFKMSGPKKQVAKHADALRKSFGADKKSEEEIDLDDVKN